jgi:hypothetical protein
LQPEKGIYNIPPVFKSYHLVLVKEQKAALPPIAAIFFA